MGCSKCKAELDFGSKFCNKCGEIIKEDSMSELVNSVQKHWFLYGYMNGLCSTDKELRKSFEENEKKIIESHPQFSELYKEIKEFTCQVLKEFLKKPIKNDSIRLSKIP